MVGLGWRWRGKKTFCTSHQHTKLFCLLESMRLSVLMLIYFSPPSLFVCLLLHRFQTYDFFGTHWQHKSASLSYKTDLQKPSYNTIYINSLNSPASTHIEISLSHTLNRYSRLGEVENLAPKKLNKRESWQARRHGLDVGNFIPSYIPAQQMSEYEELCCIYLDLSFKLRCTAEVSDTKNSPLCSHISSDPLRSTLWWAPMWRG